MRSGKAARISFLRSKYFKAKPFQLPLGKFHCTIREAYLQRICLAVREGSAPFNL